MAGRAPRAEARKAEKWLEHVETSADVLARFENGSPALTVKNKRHYLACWPDADLLKAVIAKVTDSAKLQRTELPQHIRIRKRGDVTFAFNYGPESYKLDGSKTYLLGSASLRAFDVAAWRE